MTLDVLLTSGITAGVIALLGVIAVWSLVWKGIALWRCGRNNQLTWFVVLLILNTAGILPIIYILFFQRKTAVEKRAVIRQARKQAKKKR